MSGPSFVQVPPDSTGKTVHMLSATVGAATVYRQVVAVAGANDDSAVAEVVAASASTGAIGVVVRPTTATVALVAGTSIGIGSAVAIDVATMPTVTVTGTVSINSVSALPAVAISGTATIAGSVGINSIGAVAISGTPTVVLAAGTANFGTLNNISRTVVDVVSGFYDSSAGSTTTVRVGDSANSAVRVNIVAGGTGGGLVSVTGTVIVAVSTPFTINNISATAATTARLVTGGAYDNTAGDALKVFITGGGTGGGTVTLSSGATIRGVFDSSAGSTTLVRVGDSANSAIRVNVVAGGTGGGTIDRISATTIVAGVISLGAGTANIGFLNNISATVTVAGVVGLTAGTAVIGDLNAISRTVQVAISTPFTINNISATAAVTGSVALVAGTANIGTINDISRTVQVAVGTPFILQGISTTVNVAIATPFTIQGISTSVTVVGNVNISTMPAITGSIGINSISAGVSIAINAISAGVTVGINSISGTVTTQLVAPAVMSASRGPKCVTASTSANVTLIASPGAGANIRVTMLSMHNASGTFTSLRFGTSASAQTIVVPAASSGGGAVFTFNPPIVLSASEAAVCSVKPNANYGVFNVMYYVV